MTDTAAQTSEQRPPSEKRPAEKRRRRWPWVVLTVLLLLLALLCVAAWLAWRASGVSVQGVRWQGGLQVERWTWSREGCQAASGEQLQLAARWPLDIRLGSLTWHDCPAADVQSAPLDFRLPDIPRTPPLSLVIDELHWPGLPALSVTARQNDQHWTVGVARQMNHAELTLDQPSGDWTLAAQVDLPGLLPDWLGSVQAQGQGTLVDGLPQGTFSARAVQLGHVSQPQRADARLAAQLVGHEWSVTAALSDPVALPGGWVLEAGDTLTAQGHLERGLLALNAAATANGPLGQVAVQLATDAPGVAQGQGSIRLSGDELQGELPLRWQENALTLAPSRLVLPQALVMSWDAPVVVPIAAEGETHLPMTIQWETLTLNVPESRVRWSGSDWHWQGALAVKGDWSGYRIAGQWQGEASAAGVRGQPARLSVRDPDLTLNVRIPVAQLAPPVWRTDATFDGQYQDFPLKGGVQVRYQDQLEGRLRAESRLVVLDQGGELQVDFPWQLTDDTRLRLLPGQVRMQRGLLGTLLVYPMTLRNDRPLYLDAEGLRGSLALQADGALAERWRIPAVTGTVTARGMEGDLALAIADWQSTLKLNAVSEDDGFRGQVEVATPLSPELSHGLGVIFRGGLLDGQGTWAWRNETPQFDGRLRLRDLQLDWGGIRADGGAGELALALRGEDVRLHSLGPVTLDELNVGTAIRNLRMTLDNTDLAVWEVSDIYADVLGGYLRAPALTWPSPGFQTIVISRINLDQVAALQNDPVVQLAGRVGGFLPLQLGPDFVAVQGGRLANEEPLALLLTPSASTDAMAGSNMAVQLALESLAVLQISEFQARVDMSADGWLDGAVTVKGVNPQRKRLPVVFNYTHRENVLVLLRSLRIGDEISRQVMDRLPKGGR